MYTCIQVNAGECTSWKISLFMDYKEDNPEVLKGVSRFMSGQLLKTAGHLTISRTPHYNQDT